MECQDKKTVVVVGGGYVGLPLAVEAGLAGHRVIVYDTSSGRVDAIQRYCSPILDVSDERLREAKVVASTDPAVTAKADVVVYCVPTPLRKTRDPDVSMVLDAVKATARFLSNNERPKLIILESTVYPGFTREVLVPMLAEISGRTAGTKTLAVAYSPERVDPSNEVHHTRNTPKVVGGLTLQCTKQAIAFYRSFIDADIVEVSSCDAAEMVKLLENTFRAVNIGLANEFSTMCGKLGLSTREVIDAAATKPFGFMPFYPGPGVGGHCIGPDPLYLSWRMRAWNYRARFIELADEINGRMPHHVVNIATRALNAISKPVRDSSVVLLGVAYKANVGDTRESPALEILEELQRLGAKVSYIDSYVPAVVLPDGTRLTSDSHMPEVDCAIVLAAHDTTPLRETLLTRAGVIVDTRGYFSHTEKHPALFSL